MEMQTAQRSVSYLKKQARHVSEIIELSPVAPGDVVALQPLMQPQNLLEHLPMVRRIALRVHKRLPPNVDAEDLVSAGLLGLVEATARFDAVRQIPFASYVQFRVKGSIMDSLRSSDWAPRSLRKKGRDVQLAIQTLTTNLGHVPSQEEIAVELVISLDAYQKLLGELKGLEIGALHRMRDDDSGDDELIDIPGRPGDDPLVLCLKGELERRLTAAMGDLPDRERLVMTQYYYEDMTWAEIGLLGRTSEAGIQKIRTSAVSHLRSALADLS
jgi:RNA polymerase sigma factor for flagellar operon FliA